MKREANATEIVAVLAATGARPIVRDLDARPLVGHAARRRPLRGQDVLGRLWMELHQQLRDHDPDGTIRRLARPAPASAVWPASPTFPAPLKRPPDGRCTRQHDAPRGFLHSDPKGSSRAAGGIAAEGCPEGVRAALVSPPFGARHDPNPLPSPRTTRCARASSPRSSPSWSRPAKRDGLGATRAAKSMIAQQDAAAANRQYADVRALLLDPVDLRGIPWRDGSDRTRWAPPAFLPPSDDPGR